MRPIADPPLTEVAIGESARFRCWVPSHADARLRWRTASGAPLPDGVHDRGDGTLHVHAAADAHAQRYLCEASDPAAPQSGWVNSNPVELRIRRPSPSAPQVDPLRQSVEPGRPARM